jgi:hypothetical protein
VDEALLAMKDLAGRTDGVTEVVMSLVHLCVHPDMA